MAPKRKKWGNNLNRVKSQRQSSANFASELIVDGDSVDALQGDGEQAPIRNKELMNALKDQSY